MSTLNQLIKISRYSSRRKGRTHLLQNSPQKKGICKKVYIMSPKKPCSGRRKVARIILSNRKKIFAYIPGIGHNLKEFSNVLIQGGRTPDLPQMNYSIIRGKLDLQGILARRHSRSRYGTKWWFR